MSNFDEILNGEPVFDEPVKFNIDYPNINYRGLVLAFDQSLSSTGWVLLSGDQSGAWVWATGVLKSREDLRGHEKTLKRATELNGEVCDLLIQKRPNDIVFETPPVGSKMMRPESSLLAANAILNAVRVQNLEYSRSIMTHMIARQKASKRWTGNGNAPKKEVRNSLMKFGYNPKNDGLPWNEHIADALSIGLFFMESNNG